MGKLLKLNSRLKEIQKDIRNTNDDLDSIYDEIEELEGKKNELEYYVEKKEAEEALVAKEIREYIGGNLDMTDKYGQGSFEEKIFKATLFTNKDGFKPAFTHVYVNQNCIYAIDGYRALEYKHSNSSIKKDMFIEVDNILEEKIDLSLFKEVDGEPYTCGLGIAKKVITKEIEKVTNDIFNIDKDYLMNEFLYKESKCSSYKIYIFNFGNLKIAVNKECIEDMMHLFKDSKFTVSYSNEIEPIIFSNDEIRLLVLPVRCSNIEKL